MKRLRKEILSIILAVLALQVVGKDLSNEIPSQDRNDWSPSRNFKEQTFRQTTNIVSTNEATTYIAIYRHLYDKKPGQVRDILITLFKAYIYTSGKVQNLSIDVLLKILANPPGQPFMNADPKESFSLCKVDDRFREKFFAMFQLEIDEVLAGKHVGILVSRMLSMTQSSVYDDYYAPIRKLLNLLHQFLGEPIDINERPLRNADNDGTKKNKILISPETRLSSMEIESKDFFSEVNWKMLETEINTSEGRIVTLNDLRLASHDLGKNFLTIPHEVSKDPNSNPAESQTKGEPRKEQKDGPFVDQYHGLI